MKFEIGNLKSEFWNLKVIWNIQYEIWNMKGDETKKIKTAQEDQEYETGNIKLGNSTQVANKHLVSVTLV